MGFHPHAAPSLSTFLPTGFHHQPPKSVGVVNQKVGLTLVSSCVLFHQQSVLRKSDFSGLLGKAHLLPLPRLSLFRMWVHTQVHLTRLVGPYRHLQVVGFTVV